MAVQPVSILSPFAFEGARKRTGILRLDAPRNHFTIRVIQQARRDFPERLKRAWPVQDLLDLSTRDTRRAVRLGTKVNSVKNGTQL